MPISITSFTPNTKAQSAQVNTNFVNCQNGISDAAHRAFAWTLTGPLYVGTSLGMQYIVPQNVTCIQLYGKTNSGTATVTIKVAGSELITGGFAVTSTLNQTGTFTITSLTAGQVVTLDVTAISGATDLLLILECQTTSTV